MTVYTFANWFTGFAQAYFWYLLFERFLKRRRNIPEYVYIAATIAAGILVNISNTMFSTTVLNLSVVFTISFFLALFYEGSIKARILLPVLGMMIAVCTEVFVLFGISAVTGQNVNLVTENNIYRIVGIVISKVAAFVIINAISFRVRKRWRRIDSSYWLMFFVMFVFFSLVMCTFCVAAGEMDSFMEKYVLQTGALPTSGRKNDI